MSGRWWCTVVDGENRRFLYELGEDGPTEAEIAEIKATHNVPADWLERRLDLGEPWSVSVSPGEPHPELMWSNAELRAAREQIEDGAGVPAQMQKLREMAIQLEAASGVLPEETRSAMLQELKKAQRGIRRATVNDIRAALAGTPPSRATVRRQP